MTNPEPAISELLTIGQKAVVGICDRNADFVRGSDYESLLGPTAIVWSREAARDTDLFNAVNFNTASDTDLTELVRRRYGIDRILDTRGAGTALLKRPASGVADTAFAGTRITVVGNKPKSYRVSATVSIPSTASAVSVPIEAVEVGPGSAIFADSSMLNLDDSLQDGTWYVDRLTCADGTSFEKADVFRARVRQQRRNARVGQVEAILEAAAEAGAAHVVAFRSDYAGDQYDYGLNVVYVGDMGYTGTPDLMKAVTLALWKYRVAGDCLQVLPMSRVELDISADVYLRGAAALFDRVRLERIHTEAVRQALNGSSGNFTYLRDGLSTAILRHTPEVQRVVINEPSSDVTITVGVEANFRPVLTRFVPGTIRLNYIGT